MILGLPVMDSHDWTAQMVQSLARTVRGPFHLLIIDNESETPYSIHEYPDLPFPVSVIRNDKNLGFYTPLLQVQELFPGEELIGLAHNDLIYYEVGWDLRMASAFAHDPQLALTGLCGSWQVDELGGRGAGTMCFFRGEKGQSQAAGERIQELRPALVLDSLFMMFRAPTTGRLRVQDDVPSLAHFYDRIWPMRLIEAGYRVAVLGSEIDHWGGITLVANGRFQEHCRQWLIERGLPHDADANPYWGNWQLIMYKEAERRFLSEFRDTKRMIPASINLRYDITRW